MPGGSGGRRGLPWRSRRCRGCELSQDQLDSLTGSGGWAEGQAGRQGGHRSGTGVEGGRGWPSYMDGWSWSSVSQSVSRAPCLPAYPRCGCRPGSAPPAPTTPPPLLVAPAPPAAWSARCQTGPARATADHHCLLLCSPTPSTAPATPHHRRRRQGEASLGPCLPLGCRLARTCGRRVSKPSPPPG